MFVINERDRDNRVRVEGGRVTKPKTTAQKAKAYNNCLKAKIRIQVHKMIKRNMKKLTQN